MLSLFFLLSFGYYDFYLGISECNLYVSYDKDITTVGYWIRNKKLYDKFLSNKTEITQECGELKWVTMNKARKVIKEISITGKTQDEQFKLLMDELVIMKKVFDKHIS